MKKIFVAATFVLIALGVNAQDRGGNRREAREGMTKEQKEIKEVKDRVDRNTDRDRNRGDNKGVREGVAASRSIEKAQTAEKARQIEKTYNQGGAGGDKAGRRNK